MCYHKLVSQYVRYFVKFVIFLLVASLSDEQQIHVALVLRIFALAPLANVHHFLIYALSFFGLTTFGWLLSITLTPATYYIISCGNVMFYLRLGPLFQEHNWGVKQGLSVHIRTQFTIKVSECPSFLTCGHR